MQLGLKGHRVAILATDGVEQVELEKPRKALDDAGAITQLVSLEAGEPTTIQTRPTIADGIAVARPGSLPFEIIRDAVDEIVTVSDDDIARALIMPVSYTHLPSPRD